MRGVGNVGQLSLSYKGHHVGVCVCVWGCVCVCGTSVLQYYCNSLITIKGKDLGQIGCGEGERVWNIRGATTCKRWL